MTLRKSLLPVGALAGLLAGGAAYAHSNEYLDTQSAPHGGQLRMAGVYHFELVVGKEGKLVRSKPVVVYVTDHAGTSVSTAGASGTATVLAGKTKTTVKLVSDGGNALKGSGSFASTPDMKVVVFVALAGKSAEQARFTSMASKAAVEDAEHSGHGGH